MPRLINKIIIKFLTRMGFMNIHEPIIWGDKNRLKTGKNVSIDNALINTRSGYVTIGDGSYCGHSVMLLTGMHNKDRSTPTTGYDINIGKDVWLCSGVIVIGGVTIGDNCIIGAGSVVTKDIPANSFAAGNPAMVKKEVRR